MTEKSNRFWF